MASLETDIKGMDRLKTIWAMIRGHRLVIHFPEMVLVEAIKRAMIAESNVEKPHE